MKRLSLILSGILSLVTAFAQTEIKVETHGVVAQDEQFNITFIIDGENSPTGFSWSPGEDFQLLWGPQQGHSTSLQIINGKRTKSVQTTYTYVLRPVRTGKFTLPKASAKVKGKDIYSAQVSIEVVAASNASQQSQSQGQTGRRQQSPTGVSDEDIFLSLSVNRTSVVVGEPVTATIKLYQRVNVAGFESASFPSFNGFWSQETEAPSNIEFTRETYGGQIYNAALLREFVLIPQQQGKVRIDPAELVCLVNIRVSAGGASIFDGFFDDYRTVRKKVVSNPVTVDVAALPAGAPATFGGGVGTFAISARLSKDELQTHEAGSLQVTVSGKGNVSLLEAPKVNFPPDFEVYDTKVSDRIDKNGMAGSRVYEYPFIPRSHGDFIIEPIRYSYYDVDAKKYVTLETPALNLSVAKGNEAPEGTLIVPGTVRKDVRNLGSDVRFINVKSPDLQAKGRFLVAEPVFFVMIAVVILLSMICWLVFRKVAARRADVVGTRNRKAVKMAMKRLQLAGTFLKQDLYTAFYEELHKALLGFVADKLNMPVSELSRERIAEVMQSKAVDVRYIEKFTSLMDACEFARYAPSSGHDAMSAHYDAAVDVISSIDSAMKPGKNIKTNVALSLVLLLSLQGAAYAQHDAYVDSLWNAANDAYTQGRWNDAAKGYEDISALGLESAALYSNMGNAYFKDGNIPEAILCYERALKTDPSYDDAGHNLDFMNTLVQDRIDPVPELIISVWVKKLCYLMDSDAWAVTFLVLLAMIMAMVLLFLLARSVSGRRAGFFTGIVLVVAAAVASGFSLWQKHDYMAADDAIVMRPVTSVKSSPASESSQDLFVLHEGTKVKVIDEVGSWYNVELADGRQGWIPAGDIEII